MAMCGVMRIEKRRRGAVRGLQIEANRTREEHERGRDFDKSDIDWNLTEQNIHLVKTDEWNPKITKQIHAAEVTERKNSTVLLDGLYTASRTWFDKHSPDEWMHYFHDCLEFHVREYCGENASRVINAVVHLDEATPHMHVASVPIIEDEKGLHLSAKLICGGRADFRLHQDHFYDQVTRERGLERGEIRDPAEMKAHTTKREWQLAKQEQELAKIQELTDQANREQEQARRRAQEAREQEERSTRAAQKAESRAEEILDRAKAELTALDGQIEEIERMLDRLRDEGRLADRKHYKSFGGQEYIRITPEEAKALDAAVAVKTPILEAEAEAQAIVRDAQSRTDDLLRQAHIAILDHRQRAERDAEEYKRRMAEPRIPYRLHSRSRENVSLERE